MKDYNNTEFKILAQISHSYPMRATLQGCLILNVEYLKQFNVIYENAVSLCVQSLCPCMCFYAVRNCLFRRRKNSRKYIYVSSKSQSHKPLGKYFFKILYIKIVQSILKYSCYLVSWQSTNSVLSACCKLKRNRYF